MPDPDLEMVVGGGRSPKNLFRSKNKGGGGEPPGPSPGSATGGDAPLRNGGRGVCTPCTLPTRSAPGLYAQSPMTSFSY